MRRTLPAGATPRIVVVDAYPHAFGGVHRVIEQIAGAFGDRGWVVRVVMPAEGAAAQVLRRHGVDVAVVEAPAALLHYGATTKGRRAASAAFALPRYWWRLARFLRREADLVWVNELRGLLVAGPAARLARRPCVWHLHARPRQLRDLSPIAARLADLTVVPSRAAAEAAHLRLTSVVVLANAVEPPRVDTDRTARVDDLPLVVSIARLYPVKGVDVLLRASALLHRRGVPHRLLLIGAEQPGHEAYADEIRAMMHSDVLAGASDLVAATDDVAAVLAAADVYVQPSRAEGMPLATLEAMAAGCPVVVTSAGGLPEVVDDERTGLVVPPDDEAALAAAVARLLDNRALGAKLADAAIAHVQREHSVDRFGAVVADIAAALVDRA